MGPTDGDDGMIVQSMATALASGGVLGLASSAHCAAACGGIALLVTTSGGAVALSSRARALASAHVGRISGYALGGAIVGGIGASSLALAAAGAGPAVGQAGRLLSSAMLMWTALRLLGIVRRPAMAGGAAWLSRAGGRRMTPWLLGAAWGMAPCGMVYNALLMALFSGTWHDGAALMIGFGLGTAGPVSLIALGIGDRRAQRRLARPLAILLFALGGIGAATAMARQIALFCG